MSSEIVKPDMSPEDAKMIGARLVKASKKNLKKAGELLVRTANEKTEAVFGNLVLTRVQETVQHVNNLRIQRTKLERELKFYEQRISAIQSGEYSVDFNGVITYNEPRLNDTTAIWS